MPNYGDPKTGISIHCFKHHNPNVDALLKNKKNVFIHFVFIMHVMVLNMMVKELIVTSIN